ncbi:MAG: LutC/YkgG family protein [Beijerinckiaceae bacterium]
MSDAKSRILGRLRAAPKRVLPERPDWTPPCYGDGRNVKFRQMLAASHADVHEVTRANWPERLQTILADKGVSTVLYAPGTETGKQLAADWAGAASPTLLPYDRSIEEMKSVLMHDAAAAVTTARGGIAETGSLVLWPTADEPRLMSLLPPIHVALVEVGTIADSLAGTMASQDWAGGMPTNAVLVSGPSKTADIEQTLAYGVHGPKELVVLVIGRD